MRLSVRLIIGKLWYIIYISLNFVEFWGFEAITYLVETTKQL